MLCCTLQQASTSKYKFPGPKNFGPLPNKSLGCHGPRDSSQLNGGKLLKMFCVQLFVQQLSLIPQAQPEPCSPLCCQKFSLICFEVITYNKPRSDKGHEQRKNYTKAKRRLTRTAPPHHHIFLSRAAISHGQHRHHHVPPPRSRASAAKEAAVTTRKFGGTPTYQ